MARNTLLLLIAFLWPACSASPRARREDGAARELRAMAGSWRPVFMENNGYQSSSEADLSGILWIRDADGRWTARRDGKAVVEWAVRKIDPTQNPRTIDIEVAAGVYKGVVYLGIYELDGDTLRICFALPDKPERPTDFSAAKGSVRALSEFRRVIDPVPP